MLFLSIILMIGGLCGGLYIGNQIAEGLCKQKARLTRLTLILFFTLVGASGGAYTAVHLLAI
jgi:hypothetical protein